VPASGQRVLVLAPLGADAVNIRHVLREAGIEAEICTDLPSLAAASADNCDALLLTEESVTAGRQGLLVDRIATQPAWSDLPVVLITSGGRIDDASTRAIRLLGDQANLTLVERPLRVITLVSAVKSALRARRRQYEVRDLLADREKLLASLEERVAERTARLRLMVDELEAFSYSVSHDLRSPLRVLSGYAEVLVEDYGASLDPQAKDYLDRIARAARRMDRLTQDILAYTRVTRAELTREALDLDLVFRAVIEQYPALLAARHLIAIRSPLGRIQGHLPSLIQCFSNLLENALKFVREGEQPEIEISAEPRDARVRVTVRDHGTGIAPEQHRRIFGIFERAADSRIPGTGIGLAIAKKAVERMGGAIGVSSVPGLGSRFWVELDAAEHPAPAELAHSAAHQLL
jgi:signal transduction histidine kinase